MTYQLTGSKLLFAIDRTQILDITPGDEIIVERIPGVKYEWTRQDSEFVENNPDDEIYLQVERTGENGYNATGILLKENSRM